MLKNNKGFTVVELIASFVFTSILAITLFAAVQNYRDKQTDSMIKTELLAFKSQLLIDIESDIQKKGLYSIDYKDCRDNITGTNPTGIDVPRCVELKFNDGDSKVLMTSRKTKIEKLLNDDGTDADFSITYPYISYGGIEYRIPDEDNINLNTDFFFEKTEPYDGLETNTRLYKIRIDLVHKDLDANVVIQLVANGNEYFSTSTAPYESYNIGDLLRVRLTAYKTANFRVIQDSSYYDNMVTLLYDDAYDSTEVLNSTQFNSAIASGNDYTGSDIENKINYFKTVGNAVSVTTPTLTATNGGASQDQAPNVTGLKMRFNVSYKNVGDYVIYTVPLKNTSNEPYIINSMFKGNSKYETNGFTIEYVRYTFLKSDDSSLGQNESITIPANSTYNVRIKAEYYSEAPDSLLIGSGANKTYYPTNSNLEIIASRQGAWYYAEDVRLITAKEVEFITSSRINNSNNLSLSSAPAWLKNKNYWTMSQKSTEGGNGYVWYVNGTSGELASSQVNSSYALRPVIEIDKQYVTKIG